MEELTLIIDAINKLGEHATTAFIVWLIAKHVFAQVLMFVFMVTLLTLAYKLGNRLLKQNAFHQRLILALGENSEYLWERHKEQVIKYVETGRKNSEG